MIKERLMEALRSAVEDYNGGTGASESVAKAAEARDFNGQQAERLAEMFNTAAALNQEKSAEDPAGSCELADKAEVARLLMKSAELRPKKAFCELPADGSLYEFYSTEPVRTNSSIEARRAGRDAMRKAASAELGRPPEVACLCEDSLLRSILGKIGILKSASRCAGEVAETASIEADRIASGIAAEIEGSPDADEAADLFKAACAASGMSASCGLVASYSTRVEASDGGRFARANVFDDSPVAVLLKRASEIEGILASVPGYERARDFYMSKADGFEGEVNAVFGMGGDERAGGSLADMFDPGSVRAAGGIGEEWAAQAQQSQPSETYGAEATDPAVDAESVLKLAAAMSGRFLGKEADVRRFAVMPSVSVPAGETLDVLSKGRSIPDENTILMNVRRAVILEDLLANDPIIRDADPNVVTEAYKTMVMTSPRVSLDKSQVRAFLRAAANSVAISPSDAKVISDVDRGVAAANVERLTALDSSIKDSNRV